MIKLDYQTLAIVTSILYLTFTCVFLSLSRALEDEKGLGCYAVFNFVNFVGFSIILMNPSIGIYSNLINNIGTLCGSLFVVEGACRFRGIDHDKLRHSFFVILGLIYIWMSYVNMTNTTHRYLFHDAAIVIMYTCVAYIFIWGTEGKERCYTMVVSGSYGFLAFWVSIRWFMATASMFTNEPLPKHPFLAMTFSVVLLVTISSAVGILMLLIYRAHKDLLKQARIDELTGLGNRKALNEYLDQMLDLTLSVGDRYIVLLVDVNGFKEVNDTYGHSFGDKVLQALAQLLKSNCQMTEVAARMGGDEFVVVSKVLDNLSDVEMVKSRFKSLIEKPINIEGTSVLIRVSIGGTTVPDECSTVDEVLLIADRGMYKEKDTNKEVTMVGGTR